MWSIFLETISSFQEECIPKVNTNRSNVGKPKPEWWNSEIDKLIKDKHLANDEMICSDYQTLYLEKFRELRRKVKSEIRKNKAKEDIQLGTDRNTKKLFKKYKAKSKFKDKINFVKKGNQIFTGDKNIADGFNNFFGSIFSIDSTEEEWLGNSTDTLNNINCINSIEVNREQVHKIIIT